MDDAPPFDPSPILISHASEPRNLGLLPGAHGHACIRGDCGDVMAIWVLIDGDRVGKASFITTGCGTSHACGSMATELATGRDLFQAVAIAPAAILDALGGLPAGSEHCATLAATALGLACEDAILKRTLARTAS